MPQSLTVSGYILHRMVQTLREREKDPTPILATANLDEASLAEADARVPLNAAWDCWQRAFDTCGDPLLGLAVASQVGEGYPMLRISLRNADTLGAAFERWGRFYELISDHGRQSLRRDDQTGRMRCDRKTDIRTPTVVEDWVVGQWLSLGRTLVGVEWRPLEVKLEHADSGHATDYEQWFEAPVEFGAERCEMSIAESVLALPIRGSDASLSRVVDRHIEEVLAKKGQQTSFTERAKNAMARQLDGGDPGAAAIARSLNVSERTLLRRLRDEGTTPSEVLRNLRAELAEKYLRDQDISLTEITYLLGYSEASAFHRAFKRWTGVTPAEFRHCN